MQFVRRIEKFDAIQFTGGEENGIQVIKWLQDHYEGIDAIWTKQVPRVGNSENIQVRHRSFPIGMWFVWGDISECLDYFTDSDFQKRFALPIQIEAASIAEPNNIENMSPAELALKTFRDAAESVRNVEEGYDKHDEIVAANEDAVGVGGWIIEQSKYNDETMNKVFEALHGWGDRDRLEGMIMDMQNAGILFRERI